jgi:tripartite-type tricarboxylate transporter receptor subunit TctC
MALGLGVAASTIALPSLVAAQRYPTRPVRMVVPFPPGGSTDIYARILAAKLSDRLGQPVLVDNRPGAGGAIAASAVIRSEPDGHTILYNSSALAILPSLTPNLGFDVRKELTPVALIYEAPLLVITTRAFAPTSIAEVIAAAKAAPGRINLAHSGNGTTNHLAAAKFIREAGIDIVLVPYAGNAGVLNAMLRGDVGLAFDTIATAANFVREGKLRAMAVTSAQRSPAMPEVPTVAESGLPGYDAVFWNGVFAPAGTPAEIVGRLNATCHAALQLPDVVERIQELGSRPAGGPPEVMARRFEADFEAWRRVIHAMNLRSE